MIDSVLSNELRDSTDAPTDEARTRMRAIVMQHIAEPATSWGGFRLETVGRTRPTARRRLARLSGFTALAVGGLSLCLIATGFVGFAGWRGGSDSAAADVLHRAASVAETTSDPVVGPGQYLKIATTGIYRFTATGDSGQVVGLLTQNDDTMFVPYDRSQTWEWQRGPEIPVQTFGPESEVWAEKLRADPIVPGKVALVKGEGGAFYGGAPIVSSSSLAALPRDPTRLLNHIYWATLGSGRSRDGEALVWIADTLRSGIVPADLRAALFEAAAEIPGVTVTEQVATINGRVGVAIGRVETVDETRQDIIVDPATGLVIGEREVQLVDGAGVPAGTVLRMTSVETTVVDEAP